MTIEEPIYRSWADKQDIVGFFFMLSSYYILWLIVNKYFNWNLVIRQDGSMHSCGILKTSVLTDVKNFVATVATVGTVIPWTVVDKINTGW